MSALLFWLLLAFGVGAMGPLAGSSDGTTMNTAITNTTVVMTDDGTGPPPPPPPPGPKQQ